MPLRCLPEFFELRAGFFVFGTFKRRRSSYKFLFPILWVWVLVEISFFPFGGFSILVCIGFYEDLMRVIEGFLWVIFHGSFFCCYIGIERNFSD